MTKIIKEAHNPNGVSKELKEEIFNQIKQNGCKCYWHSNKNNLNQDNLIKTIEKNKECIINGKIGNSFADVIKDKNNE